ncbi:uncharacterized protein LOC144928074 isoform X2 [Branchiostoma floridae x Branchiostoma belcheri]
MARTTVENIFAGCDLPTCAWRAQTVHVKPPPNAPSSSEATDVYIPGAETSVPSPGRAVGRGQKVSLRSVPVYMQRPSAKTGHTTANGHRLFRS